MAPKAQASSEGDSNMPPQSAGKLSPAADARLRNQGPAHQLIRPMDAADEPGPSEVLHEEPPAEQSEV